MHAPVARAHPRRGPRGLHKVQGAGDQGMVVGYACSAPPHLMPSPTQFAHAIIRPADLDGGDVGALDGANQQCAHAVDAEALLAD